MSLGKLTSEVATVRAALEQIAAVETRSNGVLVRGELGSGRETVLRELRELSRPGAPFVVLDVAAVPPLLLESTLFGHEQHTFTGGHVVRRGVFETVESGTLVLREIAAIPLELQPKLVRVLESREFRRVGSRTMNRFTGRVCSTTHCALEELVSIGWFRPELLAAIARDADVTLPPLRERIADLPAVLARHGITLDAALLDRVSRLSWRGNFPQVEAFVRMLGKRAPKEAITELELLEAIEDNPADVGSRLVYGDLLAARGDPRGELIQLQTRMAESSDHKMLAAERKLLEANHKVWTIAVDEVASTPAMPARASFVRGFVDHVTLEAPVLRRMDAVLRAAPLLTRITATGDTDSDTWVSPRLSQLQALELTMPTLGWPALAMLAVCPYLHGLRTLELGSDGDRVSDDFELRQIGIEALATSPHLAGVTTLALISYQLDVTNLATLLAGRWRLAALILRTAGLGPTELTAFADPGARELRSLDLTGSSIHVGSARVLAGAASLTNLTTLRVDCFDADSREILLASSVLARTRIYDGSVAIR